MAALKTHPVGARAVLALAWPVMISMVSYTAMTLADALFVGQLGTAALETDVETRVPDALAPVEGARRLDAMVREQVIIAQTGQRQRRSIATGAAQRAGGFHDALAAPDFAGCGRRPGCACACDHRHRNRLLRRRRYGWAG